uniref:Uncharacterized protein n=1 Tax=Pyramimonas obovata TaxID=1411642 RepID=A0A7S0RXG3_9CHLO
MAQPINEASNRLEVYFHVVILRLGPDDCNIHIVNGFVIYGLFEDIDGTLLYVVEFVIIDRLELDASWLPPLRDLVEKLLIGRTQIAPVPCVSYGGHVSFTSVVTVVEISLWVL